MKLDDVRTKLEVLDANRQQIERLRAMSEAEFMADVVYLDSALHRLQTSIQALLDVGAYVIGSLGLPAPRTSVDIIRALAGAGHIAHDDSERYERMVAFRNRVVHLYNRIDPQLVHAIVRDHAADLDQLRDSLAGIIAAHSDQSEPD